MKKVLTVLLTLIIFTSGLGVYAHQHEEFVRLRILEEEGAIVEWHPETRDITVEISGIVIKFTQGSPIVYVNDIEYFTLSQPIRNIDRFHYIYLPDLIALFESFSQEETIIETAHLANTIALLPLFMAEIEGLANVPGMAVAIVDYNNDFVFYGGFGLADASTGQEVDEHTVFGVASISKVFTAIAIMQLVEQGLIDLDAPVINYLPDFYVPPSPTDGGDYSNITIRMLLTHTSGINNDFLAGGVVTTDKPNPDHLNNFLENIARYPSLVPVNSAVLYNNNAYNLLGIIAATVAGYDDYYEGFIELTRENIFAPLGMNNTSFAVDENLPRAMGHDREGLVDEFLFYNGIPAGGLNSTAYDMSRFIQAVFNGGILDDNRILQAETLSYMFAPQEFNFTDAPHTFLNIAHQGLGFHRAYAFGLAMDGFSFYGHNGNLIHHHSDLVFSFDNGIGAFITFNGIGAVGLERIYSEAILRVIIDEIGGDLNLPPMRDIELIESEEFEHLTGVYLFTSAEDFTSLILTDEGFLEFINYVGLGIDVTLYPLSDGSFITENDATFWFNLDYEEVIIQLGPNREMIAGARIDLNQFSPPEGFEDFIGVYVPVTEDNHVSVVTKIEIGISEHGIPYLIAHALHGLAPIAPLAHIEGNSFVGNIEFVIEDDDIFLMLPLARFIKVE